MLQETILKNGTVFESLWLFFIWKLQNFLNAPRMCLACYMHCAVHTDICICNKHNVIPASLALSLSPRYTCTSSQKLSVSVCVLTRTQTSPVCQLTVTAHGLLVKCYLVVCCQYFFYFSQAFYQNMHVISELNTYRERERERERQKRIETRAIQIKSNSHRNSKRTYMQPNQSFNSVTCLTLLLSQF